MKLIIGIGNPGEKYVNTRHNIGFMVIDELVRQMDNDKWLFAKKFNSLTINHQSSIIFCKPQTFMNASGVAVKKLSDFYKINAPDIWVIHDDLDIILGEYKIQKEVGPKLHGGIESIEKELGKSNFWRVRVGVDNRIPDNRIPGEEYVLREFSSDEVKVLDGVMDSLNNDLLSRLLEENG